MRGFLSAMVLAASFALLVPDNGAQAVNSAEARGMSAAPASQGLSVGPASRGAPEHHDAPVDTDAAVLLALGFLGAVMARRLRAD